MHGSVPRLVWGLLLVVGAALSPAAISPAQEPRPETYRLTVQTSMTAAEPAYRAVEKWLEEFHRATGGRLAVELVPQGSLARHDEVLEAVAAGTLDGALTPLLPFADREPAFALVGDPVGGYDTPWQLVMWCEHGGGAELINELLESYDARLVACATLGREAFVSRVPIEGVDDLRGRRIRAPEGLARDLFRRAGAAPVSLPPGEVVAALERGRIDATDWSTFALNEGGGLHRIAEYPIYPGIHSMPLLAIVVNEDSWRRLPGDLRALFEIGMRDLARRLIMLGEVRDRESVAEAKRRGLEVIDWPQEERDTLRAIARDVWQGFAEGSGGSRMARKAYRNHLEFMERIGLLGVERREGRRRRNSVRSGGG